MNVREKAREISAQYEPIGVAEDGALEMAEWFKELLEKRAEQYRELSIANVEDQIKWHRYDARFLLCRDLINNLFGEF